MPNYHVIENVNLAAQRIDGTVDTAEVRMIFSKDENYVPYAQYITDYALIEYITDQLAYLCKEESGVFTVLKPLTTDVGEVVHFAGWPEPEKE